MKGIAHFWRNAVPVKRKSPGQRFKEVIESFIGAFIIIPTMLGLLFATLLLPTTVITRAATATATQAWDNIDVDLSILNTKTPSHVYFNDAAGNRIATFYAEDREEIDSLDEVSPILIDAVISTEDRRFFDGAAIDLIGTARAMVTGYGGASGIVQQQAKLLCAESGQCITGDTNDTAMKDRSIKRKVVELKYSAALIKEHTPEEILTSYFNSAYFGNGAYGIKSAARRYFSTTPDQLNLEQSAMLAGLLKSPSGYDPLVDMTAAINRRDTVLSVMVDNAKVTQEEIDPILSTEVTLAPTELPNGCDTSPYPYYCEAMRTEILNNEIFGTTLEEREAFFAFGGFTVTGAIDPTLQNILKTNLDTNFQGGDVVAAQAVVEAGTGKILAAYTTTNYADTQFDAVMNGQVQVGSAFKPIVAAAAYETGFDPTTKISGASPYTPASGNAPEGGFQNIFNSQFPDLTMADALGVSSNTFFIRLAEQIGTTQIADTAYKLGMRSMNPETRNVGETDLSLALGSFESTVVDMANINATLVANGLHCQPMLITAITNSETGEPVATISPDCNQAIKPATAKQVMDDIASTKKPGGTAEHLVLNSTDWRGKTGTTNDFGATWLAGSIPGLGSATWLGDMRGPAYPAKNVTAFGQFYDEPYGGDVAGRLWANAMDQIAVARGVSAYETETPIVKERILPDVVGLEATSALALLQAAGFNIENIEISGPGTVTSQSPQPGTTSWRIVTLETNGQTS